MLGSEILLMAKQWPCKESKLDDGMSSRRSSWRNKQTVLFERARSGVFSGIFLFRHCSGHWESWISIFLIFLLGTTKVPTRGRYNDHAKTATLTEQLHSQQVSDAKNEQDYSEKLNQGFSFLFFPPSALLWPLRKLDLKNFRHIPTGYYIRGLLATTGYWLGFKSLKSQLPKFKFQTDATRATGIRRS